MLTEKGRYNIRLVSTKFRSHVSSLAFILAMSNFASFADSRRVVRITVYYCVTSIAKLRNKMMRPSSPTGNEAV